MTKNDLPILEIHVGASSINRYSILFQGGVDIETDSDCSIGDFLDRLPGFTREFITESVQTIFLNGSAMDNLEAPLSGDRPVLALSAAMPGLAGAIFRRNSIHAALRSKGSDAQAGSVRSEKKIVRLKLFNMIATEKGEALLAAGVSFTGPALAEFFSDHRTLLGSVTKAALNGQPLEPEDLVQRLPEFGNIHLRIRKEYD